MEIFRIILPICTASGINCAVFDLFRAAFAVTFVTNEREGKKIEERASVQKLGNFISRREEGRRRSSRDEKAKRRKEERTHHGGKTFVG